MDPLAALLSERPPQQLSVTELRARIALLEDAARAYRAELESRMGLNQRSAEQDPEQLCNALKNGEVLLDLIKLLVPRLAQSDRTKTSTAERNLQNFFDIVTDVEGVCACSTSVLGSYPSNGALPLLHHFVCTCH